MVTIALLVVGYAAVVHYMVRNEGYPRDAIGRVLITSAIVLGLFFPVLIGSLLATFIGEKLPAQIDKTPSHEAELVALRSADGVEGSFRSSFFLGIGHLGSQQYYFWYERGGAAGGVTPRQKAVGVGVYVIEGDHDQPRIRIYDWHFKQRWWSWFAFDNNGKTWEFHVPKGTIKLGYAL